MQNLNQERKALLGMAGEFLVAAELFRRGIQASVTYGASKAADVFAITGDGTRAVRIEVKTTPLGTRKWVGLGKAMSPLNRRDHIFYVLVELPEPVPSGQADPALRLSHSPRFFVLSSYELGALLDSRDEEWRAKYAARHGRPFAAVGVPQLATKDAYEFENAWDKIRSALERLEVSPD